MRLLILSSVLLLACNNQRIENLEADLATQTELLGEAQDALEMCVTNKITERDSLMKRVRVKTKIITATPDPIYIKYDSVAVELKRLINDK